MGSGQDRRVVDDPNLLTQIFVEQLQSEITTLNPVAPMMWSSAKSIGRPSGSTNFRLTWPFLDCYPYDMGTTSGAPGQLARQAARRELRSAGEAAHGTKVVR
jgi:hypothetical protein